MSKTDNDIDINGCGCVTILLFILLFSMCTSLDTIKWRLDNIEHRIERLDK
jgi:hypothetical protein